MLSVLLAFALSSTFSFVTALAFESWAPRWRLVDLPDQRKNHAGARPIAGVAPALGLFIGAALWGQEPSAALGVYLGGALVMVLGLTDDRRPLSPYVKLAGQVIAALFAVVASGWTIREIDLGGLGLDVGLWAVPFTALWIVTVTNAINLIDGLDGLAVGCVAIASLFVVIAHAIGSDVYSILPAVALLGACLGFLPRNWPPARVFLGDGGSYFIGFTLAFLALGWPRPEPVPFTGSLLLVALPLADTVWAIVRRAMKRRSILRADREHIHHRLIARGWKTVTVLAVFYVISALSGLAALILMLGWV